MAKKLIDYVLAVEDKYGSLIKAPEDSPELNACRKFAHDSEDNSIDLFDISPAGKILAERVKKLYYEGYSIKQISEHMTLSYRIVRGYLGYNKLPFKDIRATDRVRLWRGHRLIGHGRIKDLATQVGLSFGSLMEKVINPNSEFRIEKGDKK